jgi:hypothetical protein
MKKLYIYITLAIATLTMQSCLHDNDDVFDKSAAERIDEAVANAKQMLISADNGWSLEYYLGSDYVYGGYNMLVKFGKDGKAHLSSEIAKSDSISSSSWDITKDQDPVLTFPTYNALLHELTQPYQDEVNGYEGDYEFVIMKVTQDTIFLQGKKWKNEMIMTRIPQNMNWVDHLDSIATVRDNFIYLYKGNVGGKNFKFTLDADKQFTATSEETVEGEEIKSQFIFTTKGIKLRKPVVINGETISTLEYKQDESDVRKSMLISDVKDITLEGDCPSSFQLFSDLEGSYLLTANNKSAMVMLEPIQSWHGKEFRVKNMLKDENGEDVDVLIGYDPVYGRMTLQAQYLGSKDQTAVYLGAWALAAGGSISFSAGVVLKWNGDAVAPVYSFEPDGAFQTDSFILFGYTNEDWDSFEDWTFTATGSYQLPYLSSMKKL